MANIVVTLRNFLLNDSLDSENNQSENIPAFYEGFLQGLKKAGNNVLCFQGKPFKEQFDRNIPSEYIEKIKVFKPDLFILFNNYFWDISTLFDQPIIVFDVDSPNAYANLQCLKNNTGRIKYFVSQTDGIRHVMEAVGCSVKDIAYIPPFSEVYSEQRKQSINIAFCGANWFYKDWHRVIDFSNSYPSTQERRVALKVLNIFQQNCLQTSDDIYQKISKNAKCKLSLSDKFYDMTRLAGIKRLRYLTEIADLGLEVRGKYWFLQNDTMAAFPEVLLCCSRQPVNNIRATADFYNSAKIGFNTKHLQAMNGFSWRVCDIMASNACLVSEFSQDIVNLGFKIPMFQSPSEAREQCLKLLNDENLRLDIVMHSQELINSRHRFKHILPIIEQNTNMSLHSTSEGHIEIITIFNGGGHGRTYKK